MFGLPARVADSFRALRYAMTYQLADKAQPTEGRFEKARLSSLFHGGLLK